MKADPPSERPPVALEYAAAIAFFSGEYRARTTLAAIGTCVTSTLGVLCWIAAPSIRASIGSVWMFVAIRAFAAIWLALSAWIAWEWVSDKKTPVRVTTDGIETMGRVWPWHRISRVGGQRANGGVLLYFALRGVLGVNRLVWTTPALSDEVYYALRVELEHYFRTRKIAVNVGRQIEETSD
jgi:hypothetical protein